MRVTTALFPQLPLLSLSMQGYSTSALSFWSPLSLLFSTPLLPSTLSFSLILVALCLSLVRASNLFPNTSSCSASRCPPHTQSPYDLKVPAWCTNPSWVACCGGCKNHSPGMGLRTLRTLTPGFFSHLSPFCLLGKATLAIWGREGTGSAPSLDTESIASGQSEPTEGKHTQRGDI